jgi:hypothetical protein
MTVETTPSNNAELIAAIDRLTVQVIELRRAVYGGGALVLPALPQAPSPEGSNPSLDRLPLSGRPVNCLKHEGWYWLADVATGLTEAELFRIPNFGRKSFAELRQVAGEHGWMMPASAWVFDQQLAGIGVEAAARFCEVWSTGRSLFEVARELGVYGAAAIDRAMMNFTHRWEGRFVYPGGRSNRIKTALKRFRSGTEEPNDRYSW